MSARMYVFMYVFYVQMVGYHELLAWLLIFSIPHIQSTFTQTYIYAYYVNMPKLAEMTR